MALPDTPTTQTAPHASYWAVAAGLLSLALLYYVSGGGWLIIVLALGLVGPLFTPARLQAGSMLRWMIRIALIALIYQVSQGQEEGGGSRVSLAIGSAGLRTMFGLFYGAEMVVQAWVRRDDYGHQPTLAVTLFSALVYLTACNVFDDRIVVLTTPVYMLFVAFALRDWRNRRRILVAGTEAPNVSTTRRTRFTSGVQRGTAVGVTLLLGLGLSIGVNRFKDNINDLGTSFIREQRFFETLGMTSQPQLGSTFGLRGSAQRILRIKNMVGDGHLRGATFAYYEGGRWGPPLSRIVYNVATSEELSPLEPVYGKRKGRTRDDMTVTRLIGMPLIFAPTNVVGLTTGDSEDVRDRVEWAPALGGIMRNRAPAPYDYIITVSSDVVAYQGPLAQPVLAKDLKSRMLYLQVPGDNGKPDKDAQYMRNLALQITKDAPTPPLKIAAITQYLLTNHKYSLTTRIGSGDPVASFLREKKDAHCEFFAASSSLLLRYAGIPTRYVTGYLGHEKGTEEGETIVRQRDAHAWTEAWVDGTGWVAVDATPGDGRPDEMKQDTISPMQRLNEWFQDQVQKAKDWLADIPPTVLNAVVVASALLPLGIYGFFAIRRATRAKVVATGPGFAYTISDETLAELSARFEHAFKRAGRPFAEDRTYTEQFAMMSQDRLAETGRQFVRLYDVARFGGRRDRETFDSLSGLVTQLEQDVDAIAKEKRGR